MNDAHDLLSGDRQYKRTPLPMKTLVAIGFGYVAAALARGLIRAGGWRAQGATQSPAKIDAMRAMGAEPLTRAQALSAAASADALLISAPPDEQGCPVWSALAARRDDVQPTQWRGYLSTTGVYGDLQGRWAFETTPLRPLSPEGARRAAAEAQWRSGALPAHIFRLPGIYGPGRSAFDRLRSASARNVVKPGQIFSRCHVEDIASALRASIDRPFPGRVYNICDDVPAPPQAVIEHAAALLETPAPPRLRLEEAGLSPMAQRFYAESKRVANARAKAELGWRPALPDYRAGLHAILAAERAGDDFPSAFA